MTRTLIAGVATLLIVPAFGQARLVINDNAWVRIDNQAWVVIDHGNVNGIQTLGAGGNIRSEGEFNNVRWRIGNTLGTYVVPFTTASGVKMPLTYQKTSAGAPNGSLVFATYNYQGFAPSWNNNNYRPTDVTHMFDLATGSVNNSDHAVDRFWIIDTEHPLYGYSAKPSATLTFTCDPGDVTLGNVIGPATPVGAQRFNTPAGLWGDFLPAGAFAAGAVNTVSNVVVPATDFFRSWTLANVNSPLPVELVDFSGSCEEQVVMLRWTTATETNNDHFTVERSADGADWEIIGTVEGAGNSLSPIDYSFVDHAPLGKGYYRLGQTDLDGSVERFPMLATECDPYGGQSIVNAWDDGTNLQIIVSSSFDDVHDVVLMDAQGKILVTRPRTVIGTGITQISLPKGTLSTGMYVVQLRGVDNAHSKRVMLN